MLEVRGNEVEIDIFQVDAFALQVFEGNPAAVCPLKAWPDDRLLQQIAQANNLSETAFFVPNDDKFQLRWFTPVNEVDLCGHATLAAAHVLFAHLGYTNATIRFNTRSGELKVTKTAHGLQMDFPATEIKAVEPPKALLLGLGQSAKSVLAGFDYIVELESEEALLALSPDFIPWLELDLRGVVVTAASQNFDFVSRCFFPKLGVNEDPVTGSAHCELAPWWANKLGKSQLVAKQCSTRPGVVQCDVKQNRVLLTGTAVDYMRGTITLS